VKTFLLMVLTAIIFSTSLFVYYVTNVGDITFSSATNVAESPFVKSTKKPVKPIQKYLAIPEWNAKIPLSDVDSGAYYEYNGSNGSVDTASLYDTAIDSFKNVDGVSCKDNTYPLITISRAKTSSLPAASKTLTYEPATFTKLFEFASSAEHKTMPACENLGIGSSNFISDPAVTDTYSAIETALESSFGQIQAQ
jgi:hypothetical protein